MPSLILFPMSGVRAKILPLFRRITTIGRSEDAELKIEDSSILDLHAQVVFDGDRFEISSLSRQATLFVNGKKTRKAGLEDLDVVRMGRCTLQFTLHDPPEDEGETDGDGPWLRKLHDFTTELMHETELEPLVERLLDRLIEATRAARGFLFLVREGEPSLHVARNLQTGASADQAALFSDSIVRRVLDSREAVLVSDALNDAEFGNSHSVLNYKLCSVMGLPLITRGNLLGVLYLGNDNIVNLFTRKSLDIGRIFASQAALLLRNALLIRELTLEKASLEQELEQIRFGEIIGASESMRTLYKRIDRVATTDIGILVTGETGVGKELVARELHARSGRGGSPFIAVNCGAIPENLIESELFGHVRGAFTGAYTTKEGSFQAADGGTLFLDEIGELPLVLQAKMLRALEEKKITKVGSTVTEEVDIRIIAATNKNLQEEVAAGRFREDLYYRLNVVVLTIPPLRDRGDDVELIARYLLRKFAKAHGVEGIRFSKDTMNALCGHAWPGNVRELENRIRKGIVLSEGEEISADDLELSEPQVLPLADARERFQRDYVLSALRRNGGNRTRTAEQLGVDPRTIFRYVEKAGDEV